MKKAVLKETQAHYVIELDLDALEQGPTILQQSGQPVAVVLPIDEYRAFQEWQTTKRENLQSHDDFEREVAAFRKLEPELMEQFPGKAVAIYQGKVIASGDDKMQVLARVQEELGAVHCYIEWVEPSRPRRVRISSIWNVR